MTSPFISLLTSLGTRRVVKAVTPERTLADVVLPPQTRRTLEQALAEVRNHALIFHRWGLGERHASGRGLVFNFAGPPGTGKTICAEAVARALDKKLLVVDYAEAESMWLGETPKNIVAAFRAAVEQNAVLLFDEADAIAMRRSAGNRLPQDRENNLTVNVLLRELETFNGIVVEERTGIWQLQIHAKKTPLAPDVDFRELAERYVMSGGDIKNAVIKAAAGAASEAGPDLGKHIFQRHFESAAQEVLSAKAIMQQSLFAENGTAAPDPTLAWQMLGRWRAAVLAALVLGGSAFVAALVALALVMFR